MPEAAPVDSIPDLFGQALACFESGDIPKSAELLAPLLSAPQPRHEVLHLAGDIAVKQQRPADALNAYQRAVERATDGDARALSLACIGRVSRGLGNLVQAEDSFRRASLAAPHVVQYSLDFAQILSDQGKFEVALEFLRTLAKQRRGDPVPYWGIGTLLLQWHRGADALAAYEIAIALDPEYAVMYVFAGAIHAMLGNFDKAEAYYRQALQRDPDAPAYYQLAQLKKFLTADTDVAAMEARLQRAESLNMDLRIDAGFALGKAYDDLGEFDRAFDFLKVASDLKRNSVIYDVKTEVAMMDNIAALFTKDFLHHFQDHSGSELAPIFVLGMPRSGTTLLEQMLAGHSKVKGGGELSYVGRIARDLGRTWESRGDQAPGDDLSVFADLKKAAERYAELTANLRYRHPRFTDKLPENFLYVGLIHLLFPKSTIVHCRRDPVATCFSCYQRRFGTGNHFTFSLPELGQYYGSYLRLMQHWNTVLPGRILEVQYEDTVADPEKAIRRVLDFCGLEYEPACLDFHNVKRAVSTSSNVQVRKPIYKSSLQHWHHYERHLGPLLESLAAAGVPIQRANN